MEDKVPMWRYWRNKKGVRDALVEQYPELLDTDPILSAALMQIKIAEAAIDARMDELEV